MDTMTQIEFKSALSKLKVLYIEDDDEVREYIDEFLQRYVKEICSVQSAEKALEVYSTFQADLMIVDINLPQMNGIDFIKQIRQNDTKTRIIVSTAYTNKEFTLEAVELQLTRYLVKPITSDDIFSVLKKAIEELDAIESSYTDIDLGEGYLFNNKTNLLYKGNEKIVLRKKELDLLKYFLSKSEIIVTYKMLENEIWSETVMTENAIRGQIKNLRKKIHPKLFSNISGVGYKIYRG